MKPKEFFNTKIEISKNLCNSYLDEAVRIIMMEFGIETNRNELLMEIDTKPIQNKKTGTIELKYYISVKPTQSLLKKFEKNFPESLI